VTCRQSCCWRWPPTLRLQAARCCCWVRAARGPGRTFTTTQSWRLGRHGPPTQHLCWNR
jgi:hypothetical protein